MTDVRSVRGPSLTTSADPVPEVSALVSDPLKGAPVRWPWDDLHDIVTARAPGPSPDRPGQSAGVGLRTGQGVVAGSDPSALHGEPVDLRAAGSNRMPRTEKRFALFKRQVPPGAPKPTEWAKNDGP